MSQYHPSVSDQDVERIVRRDYPDELHSAIRQLIQAVEVREKPRVVLACLKVANRSFPMLKAQLADAAGWWREIISEAEYPNYTKKMFRIERLSADEQERIIERDKNQYLQWLHRTGAG